MPKPRQIASSLLPEKGKQLLGRHLGKRSSGSGLVAGRDSTSHWPGPRVMESAVGRPVPIATVAPFHNSIGDISTAETTSTWLALRGIPTYQTSFWEPATDTMVIGGGEIVGAPEQGTWAHIKPMFLPAGDHILSAVGMDEDTSKDLDTTVMRDYRYVAVRDLEAQDFLSTRGIYASAVPCAATLQVGIPPQLIALLPGYHRLHAVLGDDYAVVHKHPSLVPVARGLKRAGLRVVVVDMQAHARHPWRGGGEVVPPVHSPQVIKGLVDGAQIVVTASLHLAIFAIGAGRPFAALDGQSRQARKVARYLRRAGIAEACGPADEALERALLLGSSLPLIAEREVAAARSHLASVARALGHDS